MTSQNQSPTNLTDQKEVVAVDIKHACLILFTGSHPSSDSFPLRIEAVF